MSPPRRRGSEPEKNLHNCKFAKIIKLQRSAILNMPEQVKPTSFNKEEDIEVSSQLNVFVSDEDEGSNCISYKLLRRREEEIPTKTVTSNQRCDRDDNGGLRQQVSKQFLKHILQTLFTAKKTCYEARRQQLLLFAFNIHTLTGIF
ncbi:hypothetical protein F2P81_013463 [Scophthalmus maximus]|uniref:Uncharacterized protein n=1 Tax=Scophthalmus maximus TaxID=52904 RepID=A0A6A4SJF4_SCOMX|nr:hypothetical protein F2P81_013463 [Scophthalmus maximus]